MISSSDEDEEYVYGWEKEDYKELSDSEISSESEDDEKIKKVKKKTSPQGENIVPTGKKNIEYSNILQEETDFLPE